MNLKSIPVSNHKEAIKRLSSEQLVFCILVALIYFFGDAQVATLTALCGIFYQLVELHKEAKYSNLLKEHELGIFDSYSE